MLKFNEFVNNRDFLIENLFDSKSLFKELALLNPNSLNKTTNAFQFIKQNNINGILIGGMAVSHYVHDRSITPDVDFLVSDMPHLKSVLDAQKITWTNLASAGEYEGIQVPQLDADFLNANEGNVPLNQYALATSKTTKIGGMNFNIINPSVLAIMKFVLGRNKDNEDGFKLLNVINKNELKTHLKALKNHLGNNIDAKTIWNYTNALALGQG